MMESGRYHAAVTTEDVWICYPWEAKYDTRFFRYFYRLEILTSLLIRDIEEHDALAKANPLV